MMNKFSKFIFILIVLASGFLFAKSANAATYYVSVADGNDTNCTGLAETAYVSGSAQPCPWKTIGKVNTSMDTATIKAGDSIYFKRGETFTGYLDVDVTGTAGNILTFDAYGTGNKPIIDATGNNRAVDARNSMSYITYQNLDIRNGTTDQFFIYNGASNITISNVTISGGATGINIVTGTFSDILVASTTISGYTGSGIALDSLGGAISNITLDRITENSGGTRGVYISKGTYTNIDILNSTFSNHSSQGMQSVSTAVVNDLKIENVTASNNGGYGIYLSASGSSYDIDNLVASSNVFEGLYIHDAEHDAFSNITIDGSTFNENGANGLGLAGAGDIITVRNTTSSNNDGDGFNVHDAWTNVIFDTCVAESNGLLGLSGAGDGFSFHETSTGTIKNSIAKNNLKTAIAHVGSSQVVMHNNLFSHTTNGTLSLVYLSESGNFTFYNNTIYSGGQTGTGLEVTGTAIVNAKNNIIYGFDIGFLKTSGTITEDYNDVYGAATANFSGFSVGTHSIQLDPKFTNASAWDFTLQFTSPAIDAGTNLGLDYDDALLPRSSWPSSVTTADQDLRGLGWEIGAYINPVPFTPTIGTPTVQSTSSIRWNFTDTADGETGFRIYDNTNTLATSSATTNLSYLDETGLSPNIQYTGRYVTAYNSYGNSASSSVASSIYTLANAPSTPTLTVPSSSFLNTVLDVNSNPADTNFAIYNSTLAKYLQTEGTLGNSVVWQTYSLWGSASGTTTTGLLENTQYTYQTLARNGNNIETASSTDVSKYTLVDTPTNLSASLNSNNITLTVDSFPNDTGGSSGYYFSRSGANSGWIQTNSWTDTGLSCGNSYDYSVIYRNGDGIETGAISTTKSTNGCGGGGGSPAMWTLPIVPTNGFKMSINSGASTTSNRNVLLGFNARVDIKKMAISMTGDFTDASQENYVASRQWDLCSKLGGAIKSPTCPDGTYKVYAQFYTVYGRTTGNAFASSTIVLKSSTTPTENLQQTNNLPFTNSFTKYLQYKQTNADIKRLQIFLNSDPDTKVADSGAGSPGKETNYFGILTYKAVIKFQEKYAKDVLAPWGFVKGTGYVSKTTLAKINELMGNK